MYGISLVASLAGVAGLFDGADDLVSAEAAGALSGCAAFAAADELVTYLINRAMPASPSGVALNHLPFHTPPPVFTSMPPMYKIAPRPPFGFG